MKVKERALPISAHALTAGQARAFARIAKSTEIVAGDVSKPGELLAYLVNASFAAELYLKAIMIAGRQGRMTEGHDLQVLFDELPDFLRVHLEEKYRVLHAATDKTASFIALTIRPEVPPKPASPPDIPNVHTFAGAVASTRKTFVDARYFFEDLNESDWSLFLYAPNVMNSMLDALDSAYNHLINNGFSQKE